MTMMLGKELLSGLWVRPECRSYCCHSHFRSSLTSCFTFFRFHHSRCDTASSLFASKCLGERYAWMAALCDLWDPGWGDPRFPHWALLLLSPSCMAPLCFSVLSLFCSFSVAILMMTHKMSSCILFLRAGSDPTSLCFVWLLVLLCFGVVCLFVCLFWFVLFWWDCSLDCFGPLPALLRLSTCRRPCMIIYNSSFCCGWTCVTTWRKPWRRWTEKGGQTGQQMVKFGHPTTVKGVPEVLQSTIEFYQLTLQVCANLCSTELPSWVVRRLVDLKGNLLLWEEMLGLLEPWHGCHWRVAWRYWFGWRRGKNRLMAHNFFFSKCLGERYAWMAALCDLWDPGWGDPRFPHWALLLLSPSCLAPLCCLICLCFASFSVAIPKMTHKMSLCN